MMENVTYTDESQLPLLQSPDHLLIKGLLILNISQAQIAPN